MRKCTRLRIVNRWLGGLLVVVVICACSGSPAFQRAEQAAEQGDWYSAVASYRLALAQDPDDGEIQSRLLLAEFNLSRTASEQTDAYVQAGRYEAALAVLIPALDLIPADQRMLQSLNDLGAAGVVTYSQLLVEGRNREAYEGGVLLHSYLSSDAAVRSLLDEASTAYRAELVSFAQDAERDGLAELSLAYWTTAFQVSPDSEARAHIVDLRDGIEETYAFTYGVEYSDSLASSNPPILVGALAWSVPEEVAAVWISASLGSPSFNESYTAAIHNHSYLAGYREVANPAYQWALNDVTSCQNDVQRLESQELTAQRNAHDAEVRRDQYVGTTSYNTYYNQWDQAVRDLYQVQQNLLNARGRLSDAQEDLWETPQTVVEEVWENYPYERRTYVLTATASFQAEVTQTTTSRQQTNEEMFSSTSDQTWVGNSSVGLPSDPLSYPFSHGELTQNLLEQAETRVGELLRSRFDTYRNGFRESAQTHGQLNRDRATEDYVRFVLLYSLDVPDDVSAWFDEHVGLTDPAAMAIVE